MNGCTAVSYTHLLIYIPQCGVQVPKFEVDAAMNTQQVRVVMECLSARNAAAHISNQEILKLKDINEQIRSFDLSRPTRTNGLDREFHMVIARSGNNPYVAELLPGILNRYQLSSLSLIHIWTHSIRCFLYERSDKGGES